MARKWIAVEEDDDNACAPCAEVDDTLYRSRAAAYKDYPGGVGYKDCVGVQFGNACRGRVVKRRGAEPAEDSMNGRHTARVQNLMASNRGILEQVNALRARHAPQVREKTPADWFRIENLSAEEASIYIYDEIGFWGTTAASFVEQLNAITAPKLNIHINSPGGEVFDGLAIHTALMSSKAHVTVWIDGNAASAASFIAMAADRIVIARNATMMIHEASGMTWGNKRDHRKQMDLLDKLDNNIADIYSLQAGGTVEQWLTRMEAETWYTGQEALAAGLVDEITSPDEDEEETALVPSRLSLAAFNYAGRASAPPPILPATPPVPSFDGEHGPELTELPEGRSILSPDSPEKESTEDPLSPDSEGKEDPILTEDERWTWAMSMHAVTSKLTRA